MNFDPDKPAKHGFTARETGARRESIGTKVDTTLVPYEAICAIAVGLNYGAGKYAERNFELGLSQRDLLGSIERHTRAIMQGEVIDADSELPHYILLASSVAMYVTCQARRVIIEDLPVAAQSDVAKTAILFQTIQNLMTKHNKEADHE